MNLREMENSLYEICLDVEKNVAGYSATDSTSWARSDARRHSHTLAAILASASRTNRKSLRVLNASGCDAGHQDFAIASQLRRRGFEVSWVTFEHPSSTHLSNPVFQRHVRDHNIEIRLCDFSNTAPANLYGPEVGAYDVVLFTEIAEHLDHSTLLAALSALRTRLADQGILILTTPNLLSIGNRLKLLAGKGDHGFWQDGIKNLEKRSFGHIVIHSPDRLVRLLSEMGYTIENVYTFSFGMSQFEKNASLFVKCAHRVFDLLSRATFLNAGSTVFVVAR